MKSVRLEEKHTKILEQLRIKKIAKSDSALIRMSIESFGKENGIPVPA